MKAIDRRSVLQGSAAAVGGSIATAALAPHAHAQYFGKSYIEETVAPENMDDVLRWTDTMLLAVRDHGLSPPEASRVFGIGMMAGFVAMNGIGGRYNDSMGFAEVRKTAICLPPIMSRQRSRLQRPCNARSVASETVC
ncbi:hypothetical protein N9M21_06300 [Alphaproteobacteria bacterium]|nr:hypothetical protein [Alphaproteobacteria bacterium]